MRLKSLVAAVFGAAVIGIGCVFAASPAGAVIQGSDSTDLPAERCEQRHEYREAAVWRACGIELLQHLSEPLSREILGWSSRYGEPDERAETASVYRSQVTEKLQTARQALNRDLHLAAGEPLDPARLAQARNLSDLEMLRWAVLYPDRFYRYGLYRQMTASAARLAARGKLEAAVELEARASETCARQYRVALLPFVQQHASRLRQENDMRGAEASALLARHYARLSALEVSEAVWLRTHMSLAARELSHPETLARSQHPELVRIAFRREAYLARTQTHQEALWTLPSAERSRVVEWFATTRNVDGLLYAHRFPDETIHLPAEMALRYGVWDGDPSVMLGLAGFQPLSVAQPEDLVLINRLLAPLAGRSAASLPDPKPEGPTSEADRVRGYWQKWWQQALQPGINAGFFGDASCHVPLSTAPTSASAAASAATSTVAELEGLQFPVGAQAGRWDTIVTSDIDDVLVLAMSDRGTARVWLDGIPQAITRDITTHRQVARLLMATGPHALRWEFAPILTLGKGQSTGAPISAGVSLVSVISPHAVAAVHFSRYPRLGGERRTQLLSAELTSSLTHTSRLTGIRWAPLVGVVVLLGLTFGRRRGGFRSKTRPSPMV